MIYHRPHIVSLHLHTGSSLSPVDCWFPTHAPPNMRTQLPQLLACHRIRYFFRIADWQGGGKAVHVVVTKENAHKNRGRIHFLLISPVYPMISSIPLTPYSFSLLFLYICLSRICRTGFNPLSFAKTLVQARIDAP